jgi:tetratricopeptide (TPR) repeat protein
MLNAGGRLARDQTTGLARADHLTALASQAAVLERDLGHEQIAVERHQEAVSAARELGLRMPLARQLQGLASRLLDYGDAEHAAKALSEATEIAEAEGQERQLRGDILQTAGRIALANKDPATAVSQLSEAISLLESKGESYRIDAATAYFNLATAQMNLPAPAMAAHSYLKARDTEAQIYGEDHPVLISTEYHLAIALHANGDITAAQEAISRCLRIIRRGGQQALTWQNRVLTLAIIIDLAETPPPA